MSPQTRIRISDPSGAGEARRATAELASDLVLDPTSAGTAGILVTELATNLVKHAGGGELLIRPLHADSSSGLEILALDRGPGMDTSRALRDGFSTSGSPGTGLGALQRMSTEFDLHSVPGKGTALRVALWQRPPHPHAHALSIGAVCLPHPGEEVSGDAWDVRVRAGGADAMVADGLGHGPDAHRAADMAVQELRRRPGLAPAAMVERMHEALRPTRGAAVAVVDASLARAEVRLAGVGNISTVVIHNDYRRHLVSHNGTVGREVRKIQEFSAGWGSGALLLLHSDGISSHWDLGAYPGLAMRHPALIAGVIYRDHSRGRDDVCVLVIRNDSP